MDYGRYPGITLDRTGLTGISPSPLGSLKRRKNARNWPDFVVSRPNLKIQPESELEFAFRVRGRETQGLRRSRAVIYVSESLNNIRA